MVEGEPERERAAHGQAGDDDPLAAAGEVRVGRLDRADQSAQPVVSMSSTVVP